MKPDQVVDIDTVIAVLQNKKITPAGFFSVADTNACEDGIRYILQPGFIIPACVKQLQILFGRRASTLYCIFITSCLKPTPGKPLLHFRDRIVSKNH